MRVTRAVVGSALLEVNTAREGSWGSDSVARNRGSPADGAIASVSVRNLTISASGMSATVVDSALVDLSATTK
jgi:hypothetical protein